MEYIETVPVTEVAKEMRTHPMKIKSAILNHTMPIGAYAGDSQTESRSACGIPGRGTR